MLIPENITDFLYWVKETTESSWSLEENNETAPIDKNEEKTENNEEEEYEWIYNAKWIGMDKEQIKDIEHKYQIQFTEDHRLFLQILHTLDRKEPISYTTSFEEDAEVIHEELPFFYNWHTDEDAIQKYLKWPYDTILQDVLGSNNVWLKSWGKRPKDQEAITQIFDAWYQKAPQLIPLTSHRFMVSTPKTMGNPVLSVYGSDIVVYGWDLRLYLLNTLEYFLDLNDVLLNKDGEVDDYIPKKEWADLRAKTYEASKQKNIPYWKEMILFWSSGWSSFGLQYPYPKNGPNPITRTYTPEDMDEDDLQKRFTPF